MRHGETEYTLQNCICGSINIPLTQNGLAQAHAAAAVLQGAGIHAILSSDLLRARQTAGTIAAVLGLPIRYDARLREQNYGHYEGKAAA